MEEVLESCREGDSGPDPADGALEHPVIIRKPMGMAMEWRGRNMGGK